MNTAPGWRTLDEIHASGGEDCGSAEINPFLSLGLALNLRHKAVSAAPSVHIVVVDGDGRLVPFDASSWRRS